MGFHSLNSAPVVQSASRNWPADFLIGMAPYSRGWRRKGIAVRAPA